MDDNWPRKTFDYYLKAHLGRKTTSDTGFVQRFKYDDFLDVYVVLHETTDEDRQHIFDCYRGYLHLRLFFTDGRVYDIVGRLESVTMGAPEAIPMPTTVTALLEEAKATETKQEPQEQHWEIVTDDESA